MRGKAIQHFGLFACLQELVVGDDDESVHLLPQQLDRFIRLQKIASLSTHEFGR